MFGTTGAKLLHWQQLARANGNFRGERCKGEHNFCSAMCRERPLCCQNISFTLDSQACEGGGSGELDCPFPPCWQGLASNTEALSHVCYVGLPSAISRLMPARFSAPLCGPLVTLVCRLKPAVAHFLVASTVVRPRSLPCIFLRLGRALRGAQCNLDEDEDVPVDARNARLVPLWCCPPVPPAGAGMMLGPCPWAGPELMLR